MGCIEIMIGERDETCLEHFQLATPAYVHRIRIESNIFNVQILRWSMEGHRKRQAHHPRHLASAVASMGAWIHIIPFLKKFVSVQLNPCC